MIGSHAESQNYADWLDGALGVIYGLEIARSFAEAPDCANLPIAPVAWADEEGHYVSMLGSRSFFGELDEAEIVVWTTGRITLEPGAPNIIPGKAVMLFQFQSSELPVLEGLDALLV
ncbi:hypothetical protein PYH37_006260 (plasmid) [Sinorhizobium numidicum]|uniref:Uncharacterized protein n=1 Tax=Sinorhizobium numidicum TaxID=680248 RepID=A0ABY8D473_9HYPH|nr:hypothetical protein [Sinorhizobium numidicum]WEX79372.1 hypothetical protein PYH37_006260 [Sinorhizobium numidicum]WEX85671.1 hypothetical protein PYH38_006124 [Sinorhizobium numidicum]